MTTFLAQNSANESGAILVWLVLVALLALIPARIASKKGRSAVGFYIFGVLFFLPALIVALVISSKTGPTTATWGATQPMNSGITWTHTGNRYLLGYAIGDGYYGIWDRQEPGPATMKFPYTEQGRQEALTRFQQLEPGGQALAQEPAGLPVPPMPGG
jgi:hypothetical protein